jgi:uncharacterized protein
VQRLATVGLLLFVALLCGCSVESGAIDRAEAVSEDQVTESDYAERPFANWIAHRFRDVPRQHEDFTCGAASLAIISQSYYGKPVKEAEFIAAIQKTYSKEEWKKKLFDGFSLLDMKHAAEKLGFAAEGLKLTVDQLRQLKGPVVLHLDKGIIKHFTVFKGVQGDRAYIADPILGNSRVPLYRFNREWTGYALAIWLEGRDLPKVNRLAVSAGDVPVEWEAARDALYHYEQPSGAFSPFNQ